MLVNKIAAVEVSGEVLFVTVMAIEKLQSELYIPVIVGETFTIMFESLRLVLTFAIKPGAAVAEIQGSTTVAVNVREFEEGPAQA